MTGDGTFDQNQVLIGKDLNHAKVFDLYLLTAITAGHAHTLENPAGERRSAYRTWSAFAVMLTVGALADTAEAVTLNYALETFPFANAYGADLVAFGKHLGYVNRIAERLGKGAIAEFNYFALRRSARILKVALQRLSSILFFNLTIAQLKGSVTVGVAILHLSNYTGTGLDYGAGYITTSRVIDAGHSDFFSDNSVHQC